MKKNKLQIAGIVSAAILSLAPLSAVKAADPVVEGTTIMTACKLFGIDSNAGLLTVSQRVQTIQKRLDNALINANDLTPSAVKVSEMNHNPVVTLDDYLIATADENSAERNSTTRMDLAEKWAASLRMCLSDSAAIKRYISMLTGKFPQVESVASAMKRDDIAILNPETLLPLRLLTPISAEASGIGDTIEAVISTDVPLRPFFDSYLPAGTVATGEIVSASKYTANDYLGKTAFTVNFYKLRTPNGEELPIAGTILGGLNSWTMINSNPIAAVSCLDGPPHAMAKFPDMIAHVIPSKGYIVGAWKGQSIDELTTDTTRRMFIDRKRVTEIATGEPLLLKLTASTAITLGGQTQLISVMSATH